MRFIFSDLTYEKIGGGQNLILSIARTAFHVYGISSVLIGSPKSKVVEILTREIPATKFCELNSVSGFEFLPSDLFIHFHYHDEMWRLVDKNGKAILWGILAGQITEWNRFGIEKKITGKRVVGDFFTKKLIKSLAEKKSLFSMDAATLSEIEKFIGSDIEVPLMPVPIDVSKALSIKEKNSRSVVFSYVGRSDDIWKIKPVKKVVADLLANNVSDVLFNIYTDDPVPFLKECPLLEKVEHKFIVGFFGKELRSHINKNSSLHFSMGTAALEGGLAGVPTILVDPSYHDLPATYRYQWLYETKGFSLGHFVEPCEQLFCGLTINELLDVVRDKKQWLELAIASQDYVVENHNQIDVVSKLISISPGATNRDIGFYSPGTYRVVRKLLGAAS